jgi:hypothetical protein
MRYLYINIYENCGIIDEPKAAASNVIEALHLETSFQIEKRKQKKTKLYTIDRKRKAGRPKGSFGQEIKNRMVEPLSAPMDTGNEELTEVHSSAASAPGVRRPRGRPKGTFKNKLTADAPFLTGPLLRLNAQGDGPGEIKNK